jgi:hypothetical protein
MKWMPLTNDTLSQLRRNGYTRLVVKNITPNEQLESEKEFVTLEATRGETGDEENFFDIASELTETFLQSSEADYYVLFK